MKKSGLISFAVFFMMAGEAMGGWWWSPSDVEIDPQHPTSCDVVVITLSGTWGDTCMPYDSTVSVVGNDIYLDVIWPDVSCLPMITSWEWTESVGPLSVGTYTVYARLIGYPQIPEEYTQMTEFIVTGHIIYVDADANGVNDGSSWANAYNYLQDALAIANSISVPVEIRVAEGIYTPDSNSADPNGSGERTATFQLISGVALKGGYAGFGEPDPNVRDIGMYETILSGDLNGDDIEITNPQDLEHEPTRAENSYHVVTGSGTDATAVLDGFTITGGNANNGPHQHYSDLSNVVILIPPPIYGPSSWGGGLYNSNASPTVINCIFRANSARKYGGGVYNRNNSSPTVTDCTFTGNRAQYGGAMFNYNNNPMLTNCTFTSNVADGSGGGMYNNGSSLTLTDCTFTENLAGWSGGAMCNSSSSPTLTNCTLTGNCANYTGGGMLNAETGATLVNCTLNGNYSADAGGGIYNYRSDLTLTNCVFSGNSGERNGGGMYCRNKSFARVANCTFAGNSAPRGNAMACESYGQEDPSIIEGTNCILWNGGDEVWNNDNSVITITYSDVQGGWPGEGNIDADPFFVAPGYWDANAVWVEGDYHLLEDSPCIDAGDPNYIAEPNETDLDGKPRVIGGRIDMGAYEYSPPVPAEVRIVPRTINLTSKGKWITCYIWLPEEYEVADIDPNSVLLEDEIEAESIRVDEQEQVAMARFSRSEVQGILNPPMAEQVELTITGQLTDGTVFEGTDIIRVIDKGKKK